MSRAAGPSSGESADVSHGQGGRANTGLQHPSVKGNPENGRVVLLRAVVPFSTLFFALNLIGLDRSPTVWLDEVTLNDPARMLALQGRLVSSVFSGYEGFQHAYFWQPYGQVLVTTMVYKVFGFGIWQTRIPPLGFGAASIPVLYLLFLRLFRRPSAALIGCVVYALDIQFIQTIRSGRMDAQCLFFVFLGLYWLLASLDVQGRRRLLLQFLAGLSIGTAGTTHPVAVAWALAGVAVIALCVKSRILPSLVVFIAGCAVAPSTWLFYAAASGNLAVLREQFLSHGENHLVTGSVFSRFSAELGRYHTMYKYAPLALLVYAAALVWVALNSRIRQDVRANVVILFFVPFVWDTLFMVKTVGFYSLHPVAIAAGVHGRARCGPFHGVQELSRCAFGVRRGIRCVMCQRVGGRNRRTRSGARRSVECT